MKKTSRQNTVVFPEIELFDTTGRDGTQGHGFKLSAGDKVRLVGELGRFGIQYMEGGWPGSNPKDRTFFKRVRGRRFGKAKVVAFGSTCRKGMSPKEDKQVRLLVRAGTPAVAIFGKTSMLHVTEVLRTTAEENLRMIFETIKYLKSLGKTVIYDAEHAFDGWKLDAEYAMKMLKAAESAGADVVVLCDTNGGSLPEEVAEITAKVRATLKCKIGIHTHNDIGLALANALAAVRAGATHVQGTINGYGERTGNCDLISVIGCLHFKMGYRCVPVSSVKGLTALSRFVDELANNHHNPSLPWVGRNAFRHKGGMHVLAVDRVAASYEHIRPELVGNERSVAISELSGLSNIVLKARELGFAVTNDTPGLRRVLAKLKRLENEGYEYEAAEASFALLLASTLNGRRVKPFTVLDCDVTTHVEGMRKTKSVSRATVKVRVGRKTFLKVAEGDGPINALDAALRLALTKPFPTLNNVALTDFKVSIVEGDKGSASKTKVLILSAKGKREWGTVGVDDNIIVASLQALVEAMEYALLRKQ
ncbi:MAG: 2-isopropylmalate synthase/homocitrate synthase family protein [Parcubacteria group bacterium GW2011_GWA2_47_16]|nr:MAG: 2-isopropylmalate synthase/homocitrate synthase family protein [Parcubacteria group bacterium GW2011_GWA2_47_16]